MNWATWKWSLYTWCEMGVKDEAAKWGQEVDTILRKYQHDTKTVLTTVAARGHLGLSGPGQEIIFNLGQETKRALTKANTVGLNHARAQAIVYPCRTYLRD